MADQLQCTGFQTATFLLLETFRTYSKGEDSLTKAQLKTLLETEMPCPEGEGSTLPVDEMMADLDKNADNKIDFKEFMDLVGVWTLILWEILKSELK